MDRDPRMWGKRETEQRGIGYGKRETMRKKGELGMGRGRISVTNGSWVWEEEDYA